jgi:hypothetical protein
MKYHLRGPGAAFALVSAIFFCSAVDAQDESRLLFPGLLGYTGGIEDEATLLSPAAIGQITGGAPRWGAIPTLSHPQWVLNLRLGDFSYKHDGLEDIFDNVIFYGIGVTHNISDNFSIRGSVDYISDDSLISTWASWQRDISTFSLKTTALLHPAAGTLGASSSGYLNPYIGIGLELNLSDFYYNFDEGFIIKSNSDASYGIHGLAGIEYVFSGFSLGLEFSYNASEARLVKGVDEVDIGGLSILLNMGIHF